mmetsp:Transcript_13863/g.27408  ORF Transcript_13863/g.27408 Transcript_13863/m.27408 type:complete len:105 (-) Transcript_13863:759-1073(-)
MRIAIAAFQLCFLVRHLLLRRQLFFCALRGSAGGGGDAGRAGGDAGGDYDGGSEVQTIAVEVEASVACVLVVVLLMMMMMVLVVVAVVWLRLMSVLLCSAPPRS